MNMFKMGKKNQEHNATSGTSSARKGGMAKAAGGIPVVLLALAAWAVALAGVATIRAAVGENAGDPYRSLDFTWFVVFFELFVLLCCLAHLIGAGVGKMPLGASAVAGLLAVATVLTIIETRDWNGTRKRVGHGNRAGKGTTTLFAGYVALSILNGLLILILGNQHDTRRSAESKTYHNNAVEPAFPSTATPVTHNTTGSGMGHSTGMAHATTTTAPHHHQGVNVV